MANSVNGVGFVAISIIFLLLSQGIPNGDADRAPHCTFYPSKKAPPRACDRYNGNALCHKACYSEGFPQHVCRTEGTRKNCYCFVFDTC